MTNISEKEKDLLKRIANENPGRQINQVPNSKWGRI